MPCINFGNAIICINPWGRMRLGKRYVWVDFHEHCGPSFYWDSNMTKLYDPVDENDPIWDEFGKWLDKFNASKVRAARLNLEAKKKSEDLKIKNAEKINSIQIKINQLEIEKRKLEGIT